MKRKIGLALAVVVTLVVALLSSTSKSAANTKETIVLTKENTLVLRDEVSSASVAELVNKAKDLNKPGLLGRKNNKPIYLFLDTPGGSIQAGLELIEAMNGMDRKVDTVTMFAASMGFQIAQNLGERLILQNGILMSHRAAGSFEGQFGGQAPSQIDSRYKLWMDRLNELDMITVKRTNGRQTLASYQAAYANELWLTGTKSVEQGYADRIVKVTCDSSLNETTKQSINFMGINISFELSNCPLSTGPLNIQVGIATTKGPMTAEAFQKANGVFGPYCMNSGDNDKPCALDTSLNADKLLDIKEKFKSEYQAKKNKVVRMDFNNF